ncbi:MAG: response regulator transcription factor [Cyclobacteriaceae bacterium]|nr:response regulator transcription factor [Cyclobacteriaceae bacterium]
MRAKLLLAEDDPSLGYVIKDTLSERGYEVLLVNTGAEVMKVFITEQPDLCILDVMLPRKDGFTIAEEIREQGSNVPILFLTAKALQEDRIEGFKRGGDDYITKPFSIEELILRIEVFLKRSKGEIQPKVFALGNYTFDVNNHLLKTGEEEKLLTLKESYVLEMLCIHRNTVVKRETLLLSVWGKNDYFLGRSLDVYISKLRKYLKKDPSITITNHHGVGFKLEDGLRGE